MFGYIVCEKGSLTKEELERYQNVYCGLCKNLGKHFGQMQRFHLNYDMTFLILFLSSLYEPEEIYKKHHCVAHPAKKKYTEENLFTDYASYMTILLTYYKCMDDWEDERKHFSRYYANLLKKYYKEVEIRYPRQCKMVKESLLELHQIEKSRNREPDEAVNCSGKMFSEIFVYKEDFWSNSLRVFGYEMGRFIYLMDAAMDYEKDLKSGNYNPLIALGKKPEAIVPAMKEAIGNAACQFEELPMVQDVRLLRNILYSGVWQQYDRKQAKKGEKNGR